MFQTLLICFYPISLYADGGWTQITEINGVIINHVTCVTTGPDGNVWFGGHQGLFRRYTDGQWEQLLSGYVTGVAVDSTGTVWVGQENKFLKIDGESLQTDTLDIYGEHHLVVVGFSDSTVKTGHGIQPMMDYTIIGLADLHQVPKVTSGVHIQTRFGVIIADTEAFHGLTAKHGLHITPIMVWSVTMFSGLPQ